MLIALLMNFIVGISTFLLVSKVFRINVLTDFLISCCIIYFSQIVFSELILGLFNCLYLYNVFLLNVLILLIVWLVTRNTNSVFTPLEKERSSLTRFKLASSKEALREILENKTAFFLISIILIFSTVKLGINLVNPPFGWDSLNYHFTFAVEWLKNANLNLGITISDDPSPPYYPINGSLLYLWLMLPLKNVFLADLGQVPFFCVAFLAVFSLARKVGLSRDKSFYAAAIFFIIPNFFKQLSIAYVDVIVAALFFTSAVCLFLLNSQFCWRHIVLFSMSLGLLIGTKTIALPYSLILLLPFGYLSLKNIKKWYLLLLSIFIITVLGGFSYIRNFVDTGNPFYPLDFKILGHSVFKGVMDSNIYRAHFKIEDYKITKLLFHEGLGLQSLLFVLPGVFLGLPVLIIKRKKNIDLKLAYFFVIPILVYLIYRYVIPLANTRYLYPMLGISIIIGFYVFDCLKMPKKVLQVLVVISAISSCFELAKRQELATSILLTLLFFLSLLWRKSHKVIADHAYGGSRLWREGDFLGKYIKKSLKNFANPIFVYCLIIILLSVLFALQRNYIKNEFPRYKKMVKYSGFWVDATDAWLWLNRQTCGNNIAYVGRPVAFPLYGESFKNNVYYVSVNRTDPAKLHYFKNSRYSWGYDFLSLHQNLENKDNYRGNADYSVWLWNILRRRTDYLFIYSLHQTKETIFPIEDRWAKEHPEIFKLVFENKTIHIYKVKK